MMSLGLDAHDRFPRGIVYPYAAGRRTPDVPFDIALDTVGHAALGPGVLIKEVSLADAAIHLHVISTNHALTAAVHVEDFLVGREAEAVGIDIVLGDDGQLLAVGRDPEDRLCFEIALQIVADHTDVQESARRIGEPHRAIRFDDDVVRAVELLALPPLGERCPGTVLLHTENGASAPARDDEPVLQVETRAVRLYRRAQNDFLPDSRPPFPDRVTDDVREEKLAVLCIPRGAFTENDV